MKKLLALACAGSVLAIASAAYADPNTSYSLTVNGTIAAFCNITDASDTFAGTAPFTGMDNIWVASPTLPPPRRCWLRVILSADMTLLPPKAASKMAGPLPRIRLV